MLSLHSFLLNFVDFRHFFCQKKNHWISGSFSSEKICFLCSGLFFEISSEIWYWPISISGNYLQQKKIGSNLLFKFCLLCFCVWTTNDPHDIDIQLFSSLMNIIIIIIRLPLKNIMSPGLCFVFKDVLLFIKNSDSWYIKWRSKNNANQSIYQNIGHAIHFWLLSVHIDDFHHTDIMSAEAVVVNWWW